MHRLRNKEILCLVGCWQHPQPLPTRCRWPPRPPAPVPVVTTRHVRRLSDSFQSPKLLSLHSLFKSGLWVQHFFRCNTDRNITIQQSSKQKISQKILRIEKTFSNHKNIISLLKTEEKHKGCVWTTVVLSLNKQYQKSHSQKSVTHPRHSTGHLSQADPKREGNEVIFSHSVRRNRTQFHIIDLKYPVWKSTRSCHCCMADKGPLGPPGSSSRGQARCPQQPWSSWTLRSAPIPHRAGSLRRIRAVTGSPLRERGDPRHTWVSYIALSDPGGVTWVFGDIAMAVDLNHAGLWAHPQKSDHRSQREGLHRSWNLLPDNAQAPLSHTGNTSQVSARAPHACTHRGWCRADGFRNPWL